MTDEEIAGAIFLAIIEAPLSDTEGGTYLDLRSSPVCVGIDPDDLGRVLGGLDDGALSAAVGRPVTRLAVCSTAVTL